MDKLLQGKIAIVTGSTRGIGKSLALGLGRAGAKIVVTSRSETDCLNTVAQFKAEGIEALPAPGDLTKKEAIDSLMEKTMAAFGTVDILINNAGTAGTKPSVDLTEEDWDRVVNLNLRSAFFVAQAVGKVMIQKGYGKIINIGSVYALVAEKQVLPYAVAKAGLLQMTRVLALEWARKGVFVNAICPGYIITEINKDTLANEKVSKHLLGKTPLNRFAQPEEMVAAAIFLASEQSSYMTGQSIVMDGGWTIQ